MACNHSRYHDGHHMTIHKIDKIQSGRSTNNIARISPRIHHCEDCGADIGYAKVHRVWTAEEVVKELNAECPTRARSTKSKRETKKDRQRRLQATLEARQGKLI